MKKNMMQPSLLVKLQECFKDISWDYNKRTYIYSVSFSWFSVKLRMNFKILQLT